jgi:hypothetical protein
VSTGRKQFAGLEARRKSCPESGSSERAGYGAGDAAGVPGTGVLAVSVIGAVAV